MKRETRFVLSKRALQQAKEQGVSVTKLLDMIRHSVRCTHALGNRRFEEWLFLVEGKQVQDVRPFADAVEEPFYKCDTCKDKKRVPVFDECPHCEGIGCTRCDNGLVKSSIICPACVI